MKLTIARLIANTVLVALLACQGPATAQVGADATEAPDPPSPPKPDPFSRQPPPKLPFGLSCPECALDFDSRCALLPKADLIVQVRDPVQINTKRDCYKMWDPHFGSFKTCTVYEAYQFSEVSTLRGDVPAQKKHVFFVRHEENGITPRAPNAKGVQLQPSTPYVLFLAQGHWNSPFSADWFAFAACPTVVGPDALKD